MAAPNIHNLPYPDRFHAAVNFIVNAVPGSKPVADELRLVLYALHQQATVGPCAEPKPWGWNVVEAAKWESWSQLGNMSSMEAMRLYVKMVEDEQPDWWELAQKHSHKLSLMAAGSADADAIEGALFQAPALEATPPGAWSMPFLDGPKRPPPRYEHAAAAIGASLYVVGGNCSGRYLGDVWILHMDSLAWEPVALTKAPEAAPAPAENGGEAPQENGAAAPAAEKTEAMAVAEQGPQLLPPCAGHAMVAWGSKLLILGGHMKAKAHGKELRVLCVDTVSATWTALTPSGPAPSSRGGHTATLIGGSVYVFGGEDASRRPLGDLHVLDLASMSWVRPDTTGTPPAPRSAHAAIPYKSRFLVVFGGGSVAHCYNDCVLLDTRTNEWSQPQTSGTAPSPRAGHAAALLGGHMYVAGGGNNSAGCADVVALDMSPLGAGALAWSTVCRVDARSPVASEGLSLTCARSAGALIAFGGYNGKYHNGVQVYRPGAPEEAAQNGDADGTRDGLPVAQEADGLPPSKSLKPEGNGAAAFNKADSGHVRASAATAQRPAPANGSAGGGGDAAAAREEAAAARREKDLAMSELALTRRQLASAQAAVAESEAAVSDLQRKLEAAKKEAEASGAQVMRLEIELAEARKALQAAAELEKEVQHYRKLAKDAEQSKGKTSIWGYIAGN